MTPFTQGVFGFFVALVITLVLFAVVRTIYLKGYYDGFDDAPTNYKTNCK